MQEPHLKLYFREQRAEVCSAQTLLTILLSSLDHLDPTCAFSERLANKLCGSSMVSCSRARQPLEDCTLRVLAAVFGA